MPTSTTNGNEIQIDNLLNAISQAVVGVDNKYRITMYNEAAEELLGTSVKEALKSDANELLELYSLENEPINLESFCFKKGENKTSLDDVVLQANNNQFRVKIKTAVMNTGSGKENCLITITDMTKVKRLEKTKDEFLSVASHELRTPMTIIKSYLWMLSTERHGKLAPKQKDYIKKAILSTERMIELINDILNISRIEQNAINVTTNRVELVGLTKELVSDFKIKADEKGLKLTVAGEMEKMYGYVDTSKLREILLNLVGNALKFTDEGTIKIDIRRSSEFIKISIIDTGRGIKTNEQERLFLKFGRLDSSYQTVAENEGTGLGLYIVKLYVTAMGGKIGVFSEGPGKGSTFWFTVPRKKLK